MEFYWISGSAPAWRVLFALEFKGIDFESRILERSKKEQKSPWFLEINPRGQIPALRDGETILCQSLAILHYLERRAPEPPLFGGDDASYGRALQGMYEGMACVDPPINEIVQAVFRGKVEERREALGKAGERSHKELQGLERRLEAHPWLAGEAFSAADVVLIPTFWRLLRALDSEPQLAKELGFDAAWLECYPQLHRWSEQVQQMPAFERSFPPHWRS